MTGSACIWSAVSHPARRRKARSMTVAGYRTSRRPAGARSCRRGIPFHRCGREAAAEEVGCLGGGVRDGGAMSAAAAAAAAAHAGHRDGRRRGRPDRTSVDAEGVRPVEDDLGTLGQRCGGLAPPPARPRCGGRPPAAVGRFRPILLKSARAGRACRSRGGTRKSGAAAGSRPLCATLSYERPSALARSCLLIDGRPSMPRLSASWQSSSRVGSFERFPDFSPPRREGDVPCVELRLPMP